MRWRMAGCAITCFIAASSFSTMAGGVPLGTDKPDQLSASKPG